MFRYIFGGAVAVPAWAASANDRRLDETKTLIPERALVLACRTVYTGGMSTPERDGISLTHLDEPLFDGAGATKRDLVDYLDAVSGLIIGELRDRPLSVIRVRSGQQPFMQKNVPDYAPPWMRTVTLWAESSRREVRYALCDDRRTLLWFANQRAVEYHPTLARAGTLDRPR
jgi:DNA primase